MEKNNPAPIGGRPFAINWKTGLPQTREANINDIIDMALYNPMGAEAIDALLSPIFKPIAGAAGKYLPKAIGTIGTIGEETAKTAKLGTSFGKAGTLVKNPSIKINWDTFIEHGTTRMLQRGVTKEMVESWVANGKALQQGKNKFLIITKEGAAVVTKDGKLVTTYSSKYFDENIIKIIKQLYGKYKE